jgi:hypothetical protein
MKEIKEKEKISTRLAMWLIRRSSIYTFMFEMGDWMMDDKNKTITAKDEPNDTLR